MAGLDPGMPVQQSLAVSDVDRRSRLVSAATPVLDRMVDELSGTRFSILLADRDAWIVDRRLGESGLGRQAEQVCAVPGQRYVEQTSGTNALATAYELRQPISVTGEEHFLEALKAFCCYGAPILHPVTRRLEGVLDITGPAGEATALLRPFLMRAVADIEQEMLAGARLSEQRLLTEFQSHTRQKRHAVLAFGDDIVLANPAAIDLVSSSDHALLRAVSSEINTRESVERELRLSCGREVVVRARLAACGGAGVIVEVVEIRREARSVAASAVALPIANVVHIVGEPGTGRTTVGRERAGERAFVIDGAHPLLHRLDSELESNAALLIDDVHLLDARSAARLASVLRGYAGRVVLTSSTATEMGGEQSALVAMAMERVELRPLRMRRQEFMGCATELLQRACPGNSLRLTVSAATLLSAHPWPGNFRELKSALAYAVRGRTCGDITEADLPPAYRVPQAGALSMMEIAERDAILAALRATEGNKSTAAEMLGIGRTTLYARLRRYRIP